MRHSCSARAMMPAAPAAIHGRERSKVFMAILKPSPSLPISASLGSRTSSKRTSVVLLARWPILFSSLPT